MRARVKSVLASAVILLGVSACTPSGYVESPALTSYFKALAPDASNEAVSKVSICFYGETWYTTVLFRDGLLYHFSFASDDGAVKLESVSTPAQRAFDRDRMGGGDLECIGSHRDTVLPWGSFVAGGSYRFELRGKEVVGQVRKAIVIHEPFDVAIKQRLQRAASAIEMAVKLHQLHVPVEESWGLAP
jgi:hypothetical protein